MPRIEQLQQMLASEPDDVFLNYALGQELVKQGEHEKALAQFSRVIQLDPKYLAGYTERANLLVSLNRHTDARDVFAAGLAVAEQINDKHAATKIREALALLK